MAIKDIADQLVDGCKTGTAIDNLDKLYAEDAVSVEPFPMPGETDPVTRGRDGIRGKLEWWVTNHEVHDMTVDGPYLNGDNMFAVNFTVDATNKQSGERFAMGEVALYFVEDGKITKEQFFLPDMQG